MAFLHEVQRYFTIVPLAGPRRVLDDITMDGYLIPKETTILMSIGDIHNDNKIWDNPDQFIPERFIDEVGNIKNTEHIYPFGLGTWFVQYFIYLLAMHFIFLSVFKTSLYFRYNTYINR